MNAKLRFLVATLHQRARHPTSTATCCFKTYYNSQTIQMVEGSGNHHTTQSQAPEICSFSAQFIVGIQNTIEHYRHLFFTSARHKLLSQCFPLLNILLHRKNPPRLAIRSFSNIASAQILHVMQGEDRAGPPQRGTVSLGR